MTKVTSQKQEGGGNRSPPIINYNMTFLEDEDNPKTQHRNAQVNEFISQFHSSSILQN